MFGNMYTKLKNLVALDNRAPYVTYLLIVSFLLFYAAGFRVAGEASKPLTWLAAIFSHGSVDHVMVNSFLFILVGPSVERALGHLKFLFLYLFTGLVSVVGYFLIYPDSRLIGASGAICGILAVYPFLKHTLKEKMLAGFLVGFYFLNNFLGALQQIALPGLSNVAELAHVAGAVAGIIFFATFYPKMKPAI